MSGFSVFELQPTAGRMLHAAAARERLAQAYLFYGLEGTGKWMAALRTAQLIMCPEAHKANHCDCSTCKRIADYNHPDVHWIIPLVARDKQRADIDDADESEPSDAQAREFQEILAAKREDPWAVLDYARRPYITMGRVRALQATLAYTAAEGPRKVAIIINAETMRPDAQSVLLKTIEEPPPHTHMVLTASEKSALLPTILSRCQPVRFLPLPHRAIAGRLIEELRLDDDRARRIAELSAGSWARARRLTSEEWDVWRQAVVLLLSAAVSRSADELIHSIDTVFKQRPDLGKMIFLFEVWQTALHRAAVTLAGSPENPPIALMSVFRRRAALDDARAAVIGNVTYKTAVAAALLDVHRNLHPGGRQALQQVLTTI